MLDFEKYWLIIVQFLSNNLLIAAGIALALLFFFYKKPVEAVKFLGFCALLVTVLYIMSLLTESGSTGAIHKKDLKTKSESGLMN